MGLSTGSAMHIREGYSVVIIQLNIYDLNREFNLLNKIKKTKQGVLSFKYRIRRDV